MLLSSEKLKDIDYSAIKSFENFFFKDYRLKMKTKHKSQLTIGYISSFNDIEEMQITKLGNDSLVEHIKNQENCVFVYSEKFHLLKDLDIIYPDMTKIYDILNFHYSKLLYYGLITKPKEFTTLSDFYTHIVEPNFYVRTNFKKEIAGIGSIPNNSHISLFPTANNKIMMGFIIRLPIISKNALAVAAIPQFDGSYKYYIKNTGLKSRGGYFEISDLDECANYMEDILFKNAYFYKPFKKHFDVCEKEDFNTEYFKIYEMMVI